MLQPTTPSLIRYSHEAITIDGIDEEGKNPYLIHLPQKNRPFEYIDTQSWLSNQSFGLFFVVHKTI